MLGTDTLTSNTELGNEEYLTSKNRDFHAKMQGDGNLVVYCDKCKGSKDIWASDTSNKGTGPYKLRLQSDHSLVIYGKDSEATWSSGPETQRDKTRRRRSTANGGYLKIEDDGNLVVYRDDNVAVWESASSGGKKSNNYGTGNWLSGQI